MSTEHLSEDTYANIMLLGRTGVGKSSFINYLVGAEVCATGVGMPVTQEFDTFEYPNLHGIPLRIFDSKGLEVKDYLTIKTDIINFIRKRCKNDNIYEWIHSIFYCVNVESRRLEPEEVKFIKSLNSEIAQTVHVILTHCQMGQDGLNDESREMAAYISSQLNDIKTRVYCVNSVETRTRVGTYAPFGREEVLEQIFTLLWSDISHRIAKEYAHELHSGLMEIDAEFSRTCSNVIRVTSSSAVLSDFVTQQNNWMGLVESAFDAAQEKADQIEEKLKEAYQVKIQKLILFCREYSNSLGYLMELYDPFDFVDSFLNFDVDEIVKMTRLGKLSTELDTIDTDGIWGTLVGLGKAVGALLNIKALIKDMLNTIRYQFRNSIPNEQDIKNAVYTALMEGLHT